MNPMIAAAGINAIGGLLSNNNGPAQPMSDLHLVDPLMQQKRALLIQQLMGGGGDTGFGANIKQGTSQLQNMMAQRGIKVGSGGAYSGAYGNMVGTAMSNDANERYKRIYELLGMPLQIASATGKNFIPGSPSENSLMQRYQPGFGPQAPAGQNEDVDSLSWSMNHRNRNGYNAGGR